MSPFSKSSEIKRTVLPIAHIVVLVLLVFAIVAVSAALVASIGMAGEYIIDEPALSDGDAKVSDYILPDSDSRFYTREELETLSSQDRYLAINEIYARHGRGFDNNDLATHFEACPWYTRIYSPEEFDTMPSQLNEFEQANVDTLVQIRNDLDR